MNPLPLLLAIGPVITLDYPGAFRTAAFSVNSSGEVVGDYAVTPSESQGGGYLWSNGVFTPVDFPGAHFTRPLGINDAGEIVGFFQIGAGKSTQRGFVRSAAGEFTVLDPPGVEPNGATTSANGIDDDGNIAGTYCFEVAAEGCKSMQHGFWRDPGGAFTDVDPPGSVYTEAWGSNGKRIIGRYLTEDGQFHLFTFALDGSGFSYPAVSFPGAVEIASEWWSFQGAIDETDEFVSNFCSAQPCGLGGHPVHWTFPATGVIHGFLFSGGAFTPIDVPGAILTVAFGLDSVGDLVAGTYFTSGANGGEHGYVAGR